MSPILSIGLFIVTLIIRLWWNVRERNRKMKNIFRPPGLPIIGHWMHVRNGDKIIPGSKMLQEKYGNLLRINLGLNVDIILLSDEKNIEQLLNSTKYLNRPIDYEFMTCWLGHGLLTAPVTKWTKTRKMITPAFHFQILEQFIDVFNSCSKVLVEKFEKTNGKPFDVHPYMTAYTFDIICETAMGIKVDSQNNNDGEYGQAVRDITTIMVNRQQQPLKHNDYMFMLSRDYWKQRKALKIIHSYTDKVIATKRKIFEQRGYEDNERSDDGIKKKMAFLDLMMQSKLDGRPVSDTEIRDEVNTFLFAGHDTTSTVLTYALYCLANNPVVQDKLMEEIERIFGDDFDKSVTSNDMQEMKYAEMVLKESMRLYPAVPFIARQVKQDEKFGDAIIPPGVAITAFLYALHRDPKNFPDPEKFDPERFTLENQSKRGPYSFIPFSAGSRNCIGQKFAMLEMKATLVHIMRKFVIKAVPERELKLRYELVSKPVDGAYIKVIPRSK